MADQLRSPHNYVADNQVSFFDPVLRKFLRQWQGSSASLPGRFEELVIEMYERGYLAVHVSVRHRGCSTTEWYELPQAAAAAAAFARGQPAPSATAAMV
jgi:hypothetical protein